MMSNLKGNGQNDGRILKRGGLDFFNPWSGGPGFLASCSGGPRFLILVSEFCHDLSPIYNRISKNHIFSIFQNHFVKGPKAVLLTRIRYSLKSQQNSNFRRFTKWNLEKSEIHSFQIFCWWWIAGVIRIFEGCPPRRGIMKLP